MYQQPIVRGLLWALLLAAPVAIAQPAITSIANQAPTASGLPLRNIQIEVRQVLRAERQRNAIEANGQVVLGRGANPVDARGGLSVQQGRSAQSNTATQQVMVINGRSAKIALTHSTPLRVLQTFVRNGAVVVAQGTLILEVGTGFTATPRWDGREQVELEIEAYSSPANLERQDTLARGPTSARTASVISVPLGAWVSVARSDTQSDGQGSELGGNSRWSEQADSEVQVRLTLR